MTFIVILSLFIIPCCLAEIWTIYVYTGNQRFAGTDSSVFIRLFNSESASTNEYQLTHSNWIPGNNDFPLRNLFEAGAHERFRIRTENIGSVDKIQIRHNNFPSFQSDWLLDQVIVQRNRDGTKFTFKCSCWLRSARPFITISAFPDPRSIDKNDKNDSYARKNRILLIFIVVLITLVISIVCCYKGYQRRQLALASSLNEQNEQEPSLLDGYYPQSPPPSSSGPQLWINTVRQWKTFRHGLPTYSNTRTPQPAATVTTTDEPPAYEDLYPTAPINTAPNSNS